ncbi:phage protein Gp27 family protein [Pseudoalteromonas luteoviolacea]|uniref:phage protein Gp27 family protein n=1 Tax=Pseudoalteromonas luteoviolacea TaxID=43657 RepID=UPI00114EA2DB|nr:phage protein Gp27 family protein [Pseudoalteromonas luteoviolacea]TQF71783.1 DUF3486 family protein [Pseudoalteromonas luteoviolacea]
MPPRPKLEMLGILERVIKMYTEDKMEIRTIETILNAEGYDVSKSAIQRSLKSYEEVAAQHQLVLEEAKLLMDKVKNTPNTDIFEAVQSIMAGKMLGFAKSLDDLDFSNPEKFIASLADLSRAQVNIGRLRMEYEKGFAAAKKQFLRELAEQLKAEPDLLKKLRDIVKQLNAESK